MKNSLGRELPDAEMKELNYQPFESTEIGNPVISRVAPKVRVSTGDDKVVSSVDEVIKDVLKDGMTISFHHHFRDGDFVFNIFFDQRDERQGDRSHQGRHRYQHHDVWDAW